MKQAIKKIAAAGRNLVGGVKERRATKKWLLANAKHQNLTPKETRKLLKKNKSGWSWLEQRKQNKSFLKRQADEKKAGRIWPARD